MSALDAAVLSKDADSIRDACRGKSKFEQERVGNHRLLRRFMKRGPALQGKRPSKHICYYVFTVCVEKFNFLCCWSIVEVLICGLAFGLVSLIFLLWNVQNMTKRLNNHVVFSPFAEESTKTTMFFGCYCCLENDAFVQISKLGRTIEFCYRASDRARREVLIQCGLLSRGRLHPIF